MNAVSPSPAETCDFCHSTLAEKHQHLLEPGPRRIECVCDACAVLFSGDGRTKYRRVPRRVRRLPDFKMTDEQWNALSIPVGVAFLLYSSSIQRAVALYPSPGGPIESQLHLESWAEIAEDNPIVRKLEPDVEGILVYRVGQTREQFLLPIDECFKLIGIMRIHWKGLTGGSAVWERVEAFLEELER